MTRGRMLQLVHVSAAVAFFFGLKIVVGLVLVSASAHQLSVEKFVTFSQLFMSLALLSTVSGGAVQGGLTRQVAIANGNLHLERRATAAALSIWVGFATVLMTAVMLFNSPLSMLLVDNASLTHALPLVTLTAVAGGGGSILSAVLTGRRRVLLSLTLQGVGLLVSGAAAYWRLLSGDPIGAVLAYAAGPIATAVLVLFVTRDVLPIRARAFTGISREIRILMAYSASGLAISVVTPATLFGLRHAYRDAFGPELLGYWLAANRVSDVTSQLLAIYMGQVFFPRMAAASNIAAAQSLVRQTLVLGTVVMGTGWLIFNVGASFFVDTFFSSQFRPAIPFIGGYLLGDALRVSTTMTSSTIAARGRPWLCVLTEVLVAALISTYILSLIAFRRPDAPWLGYVLAQGTMTVLVFLLGRRLLHADMHRQKALTVSASISVQGSEAG